MQNRCLEYMVENRSGLKLRTFVLLPGEKQTCGEKYPCIFSRSPYVPDKIEDGPENARGVGAGGNAAGFAVVYQYCRGRCGSEGDFVPFVGEREDGLDTVAWIEKQPWFNGEIYLSGGSYTAFVHLAYMNALPASVKGASLAIMCDDARRAFYKGGAFKAEILPIWYLMMYHDGDRRYPGDVYQSANAEWEKNPASGYMKGVFGYDVPQFNVLYGADKYGPECCRGSFGDAAGALRNCRVPVLLIDGWVEMFFTGMVPMWYELPAETRKKSAFVLGPWGHGPLMSDYWKYPMPQGLSLFPSDVEWFGYLRGGPAPQYPTGKVTYYHIGCDTWEARDDFPQGHGQKTLYLSDGGLCEQMPDAGQWNYVYDPQNPASFPGGPNTFSHSPTGFAPQPAADFRPDVRSFLSAPVTETVTLAGTVRAHLTVSTDAEATMFLCRLCVVTPDGAVTVMQDGPRVLAAAVPGERTPIVCEMGPLCWELHPGDVLRLDVTSSDKHSYRVHTNTRGDWWERTDVRAANNTIYFGDSRLILPVNTPQDEDGATLVMGPKQPETETKQNKKEE